MKPKTLPARLRRTYESLPTLRQLHDAHPDLKEYQLREMLRDVPCYRCPDGSVRYAAAEAAEALSQPPPTAEEREGDDDQEDDDDADEHTRETPRVLGALQLFNESLRQNAHQAKMHGELMKVYESTLRAMVEPFKVGTTMLTDTVKELREQNKEYAERWDKLVTLMEQAQSNQHQRDLEVKREATRAEFRKELGVAVVGQLPMVLEMLGKKTAAANDTQAKDGETPSSSGSSGPTEPPPGGGGSDPPAGGDPTPTTPPESAPSSPPAAPPAAAAEAPKPPEIAVLAFDALGSVPVAVFDVIAEELPEEQRAKFVRFKTALEALGNSAKQPAERAANDQSLNHASAPS